MRKAGIFLLMGVLTSCAGILFLKTSDQIRNAKTSHTLSLILLTARKTLYATNQNSGYDIIYETNRLFPEVTVVNSKIMDEWGNGIGVEIKTNNHQSEIKLLSAGKDGLFGTSDDLVKSDSFDQDR